MTSRKKGSRRPPPPRAAGDRHRRTASPAALPPPGRVTERYAPPAPRDLPELRGQVAAWLAAEGTQFYLTMALAGLQWLPPGLSAAAGAAQVARQEHARTGGDLYWVSAPMADLARHAAPRYFPNWLRQRVEAIIWTLKNQLGLERHGGRVPAGLWARVVQRLLALNAVIWHNWAIGAPSSDPCSPTITDLPAFPGQRSRRNLSARDPSPSLIHVLPA